ncbi:hypothetical protein [Streptomyces olivaceus]|uniref:hypothetical protein n=1 Tax=Streptomyces olivaceus TaxID=47716 RepID=UPI004056538C
MAASSNQYRSGGDVVLFAASTAARVGEVSGTTQRYLHPDAHKITAAGSALSAHLSVLCAPRTLPATNVLTR